MIANFRLNDILHQHDQLKQMLVSMIKIVEMKSTIEIYFLMSSIYILILKSLVTPLLLIANFRLNDILYQHHQLKQMLVSMIKIVETILRV
jgi:hypothetical protein